MVFLSCFKFFWEIVKSNLCTIFNALYERKLNLYRLNFSMLTLIPKEDDNILV
jgi:hypothetical protein